MAVEIITYICFAYFIAALVKGITGLGFSTTCIPIMALHLDLKQAIPLVLIPSIISNLILMRQVGHFQSALKQFKWLYIATIPGLIIGLYTLHHSTPDTAKSALGLVLIIYAIWALRNPSFQLSQQLQIRLRLPVGFMTGFINGATGSQVMPIMPYLLSHSLQKNLFIQSINISFTLSSTILLMGFK